MTMFQTPGAASATFQDSSGPSFEPLQILRILKQRLLFFAIPYMLILAAGTFSIGLQRPIYRSEGKILVEHPEIPPDLVRPTITEVAYERVQIIEQRIMARDNLMTVINKFDLFPRERNTKTGTELQDLMRSRTEISPVDLNSRSASRSGNQTIAFTLSFEYEDPSVAMNVANELLTSILREDASARKKDATGTSQFLEREVNRLEAEHAAVIAQIVALKKRPSYTSAARRLAEKNAAEPEELKEKRKALAALEGELAQKSSVYASEHPVIKKLKSAIASLKRVIAAAPNYAAAPDDRSGEDIGDSAEAGAGDRTSRTDPEALILTRQEANIQKNLEEATRKLMSARLSETMESNQQGERLQVIEQPSLPQKAVQAGKGKKLAGVFGLAAIAGAASVILAELFSGSIRSAKEIFGIVDRNLIVTIPYLESAKERRWARSKAAGIGVAMLAVSLTAVGLTASPSASLALSSLVQQRIENQGAGK